MNGQSYILYIKRFLSEQLVNVMSAPPHAIAFA